MSEAEAITRDARNRLAGLMEARARLMPGADDPWVLSELVVIEGQIRSALDVLRAGAEVTT